MRTRKSIILHCPTGTPVGDHLNDDAFVTVTLASNLCVDVIELLLAGSFCNCFGGKSKTDISFFGNFLWGF